VRKSAQCFDAYLFVQPVDLKKDLLICSKEDKMLDYQLMNHNDRPKGALEIAVEAKNREREMALLAGEYHQAKAEGNKRRAGLLRTMLASLFLS
jgi:hypothetical protein